MSPLDTKGQMVKERKIRRISNVFGGVAWFTFRQIKDLMAIL
jgi:hypothetical protein